MLRGLGLFCCIFSLALNLHAERIEFGDDGKPIDPNRDLDLEAMQKVMMFFDSYLNKALKHGQDYIDGAASTLNQSLKMALLPDHVDSMKTAKRDLQLYHFRMRWFIGETNGAPKPVTDLKKRKEIIAKILLPTLKFLESDLALDALRKHDSRIDCEDILHEHISSLRDFQRNLEDDALGKALSDFEFSRIYYQELTGQGDPSKRRLPTQEDLDRFKSKPPPPPFPSSQDFEPERD